MSVPVSAKMKKAVKLLEQITGVKCKDIKDFDTVKAYLDKYSSHFENQDFMALKKPSKKQTEAIAKIEKVVNVYFTGTTMRDASNYIEKYLPSYLSKVRSDAAKFKKRGGSNE